MTVEQPTVGDRLRVVEKAVDGSTRVVTQGTVVAIDEANNRIDFGAARTKLTSTAAVEVRIEALLPELPTFPGSLVRTTDGIHFYLTSRGWIAPVATMTTPGAIQRAGFTVIHDAGA